MPTVLPSTKQNKPHLQHCSQSSKHFLVPTAHLNLIQHCIMSSQHFLAHTAHLNLAQLFYCTPLAPLNMQSIKKNNFLSPIHSHTPWITEGGGMDSFYLNLLLQEALRTDNHGHLHTHHHSVPVSQQPTPLSIRHHPNSSLHMQPTKNRHH